MPCYKERKPSQSDLLRPNPQESSRIFLRSQNTWHSLLSAAQAATHFPDPCSNIRTLLHKTPALPDSSSVTETVEDGRLSLEGYSQWKIHSISDCELTSKFKRSYSQTVVIGQLQPTFCKLSNAFPKWTGPDTLPDALLTGDYLYKLSYTDSKAFLSSMGPLIPDHGFLIPVGDADERELQWWAAILAKGRGWQATLTRGDRQYSSPWACHLNDGRPLTIVHNGTRFTSACSLEPPSSTQAQNYLLRLAQMHDAVDQLIAAFVATLTIPRHQRFGAPVKLPEPQLRTGPSRDTNLSYMSKIPSFDELPYFMIPKVCTSFIPPVSLEATVWTMSPQSFMNPTFHRRPNVRRNLRLEKVIPREDEFRLLYITDFNSENYATVPLCPYPPFGVAKLQETALEVGLHVSCGHRLAYSHWVWQGQQREESMCLDDYGFTLSPSISPVQQSRDRCLALLRWNTKILQQIRQKLLRLWTQHHINQRQVLDKSLEDEGLSERATRNLFQWVLFNDGVKLEDKEMWHHEWLELLLNTGDEDTVPDDNSSSSSLVQGRSANVSHWLQSMFVDQ
ncbi:hypothetical protein AJ80_05854 [Polytolypa hystricis UAMH7299]|uniref:Uncharacterized protein n=1 Tax=Polytolypa hystricis (strain UAMH7299) TaxID=1447883 RepID=A0A2B7Y0W2_POLH7|nr:hypothetical protein AJ80_05854 [Polytolypa hystricis UAMH7299]